MVAKKETDDHYLRIPGLLAERYPFPQSSQDHHWLECGNCGARRMVPKGLTGIFCPSCKNGSLRAVEEAEG